MILCNLVIEIEPLLDEKILKNIIDTCIHEVMDIFFRPESGGIIVENVELDGTFSKTFEGRLVNYGHAIEAMWFIMDLGVRLNRNDFD